ncbi:adhesion G protein-coupled receptor L3-like [Exaiptasia diaphana]|uniref:Uncharacterized protein n=1 Tax=Exaiptasia diaphana TaxID=2652724 RepID=A0A913WWM6_EXADI|nr:adhesion G protein-coupled receptor L3-like [Exaiptasia diaphana]
MAYFFTIFNSLQGVFIFLFHCIGDEKVRREYLRILCCRDKGPAYTIASKTPKSEDSASEGKLLKSTDKGDSKVMNFNTASTVRKKHFLACIIVH